jgi:hypothetical protein
LFQDLVLEGEHLPLVALVVVATEVKDTVYHGLDEVLGVLGADDDIAQLAGTGGRTGFIDRKREHVGGSVASSVLAVELAYAPGVDERHCHVPLPDAGRVEGGQRRHAQLARSVDEIELENQTC